MTLSQRGQPLDELRDLAFPVGAGPVDDGAFFDLRALGPAGGADMLPLIVGERASNAPETGDFAVPPTDYVVAHGEPGNTPEENEK